MTEQAVNKTVNSLLFIAAVLIGYGTIYLIADQEPVLRDKSKNKITIIEEFDPALDIRSDVDTINPYFDEALYLKDYWITQPITFITVDYEYLGTYFITAYSDEETWSRMTASGEEVHYSDEWYIPSSCAIDRNYHSFYEEILVGDPDDPDNRRIYITEDTGSGVKGRWVDCFVETLEEVNSFPTRFDSVWSVSYEEHYMTARERRKTYEWFNDFIHCRSSWTGVPYRSDC